MIQKRHIGLSVALILSLLTIIRCTSQENEPPGIVIDSSPAPDSVYVGCPSIAILPNGDYIASHSWFGPGTSNNLSVVFTSQDKGLSWKKLTELDGQWWSSLFVHNNALYIMGVDGRYGNVVIRRSDDAGRSWTTPTDVKNGLLLSGSKFHTAPVPVIIHNGRIWRGFEERTGKKWGTGFSPFVMSAPLDADLLYAASWTASNRLAWGDWSPYGGWLEGNIVKTPNQKLVNILRLDEPERGGKAAVAQISQDGKSTSVDPKAMVIDFPGGCKKFTIRHDPESDLYWSLTNYAQDKDRANAKNVERQRNTLALTASSDLKNWQIRSILLYHPEVRTHGFQYIDWQFDNDDIIAVSRTAFGDAPNCHNANYFTFHRVTNFRERMMHDNLLSDIK